MIRAMFRALDPFYRILEMLTPLGDLAARLWVAHIFFKAAWVKLSYWDSTLALFRYEYKTPLLDPTWAAYIGTGAEIVLPILLAIGLGGRFVIFAFFAYNAIAVLSYPYLWTPEGLPGLHQHVNWGLLLMLLMFHGSGKLSLDHWLKKYVDRKRSEW